MQELQKETLTDYILASVIGHASHQDQLVEDVVGLKNTIKESLSALPPSGGQGLIKRFSIEKGRGNRAVQNEEPEKERTDLMASLLLFHNNANLDQLICTKLLENYLRSTPDIDIVEVNTQELIDYSKWSDEKEVSEPRGYFYGDDRDYLGTYIGYGTRHKHLLQASKEEEKILNQIRVTDTVFTEIEQCALETAKLFLKVLQAIDAHFKARGQAFYTRLAEIDRYYREQNYPYHEYEEYWMWKPSTGIFSGLIKPVENEVRTFYRHTRKRDVNSSLRKIKEYFPELTLEFIQDILQGFTDSIALASTPTEIALNASNRARWRQPFKDIKGNFKTLSARALEEKLDRLLKLNRKNTNLANIYFEAAKLCVPKNKILAIQYYCQHLVTIKMYNKTPKVFSASVQKKLFSNEDQKKAFEDLLSELTKTRRLGTILHQIPEIYKKKRKAIVLDANTIATVNNRYSETVDKLGAALVEQEEEAEEVIPDRLPELLPEPSLTAGEDENITNSLMDVFASEVMEEELHFDTVQIALLQLFIENDNELSAEQIGTFAQSKSRFSGQLINGINEHFMETMEDVLIEEEEDNFGINTDYLEMIKSIL